MIEASRLKWLGHPAVALAIGLAVVPLAKIFFVPAYVFNFMATLVHECGHSVFAWIMGCPSIPTLGLQGGGVAPWWGPFVALQVTIVGGCAVAAWMARKHPVRAVLFGAAGLVVGLLMAIGRHDTVIDAGGVLFELGGAVACFHVALAVDLERPFERPLYATWGWWMLANRTAETWLMLRDPAYWESHRIYESGIAAGLINDIHKVQAGTGLAPLAICGITMALCLLVVPTALATAWWKRRSAPAS